MSNSEKRRVFLAVWPSPRALEAIEETVANAKSVAAEDPLAFSAIRWLKKETWHLTVVFVGTLDPTGLDDLKTAAASAARECKPFQVKFGRAGAFPGLRRPQVLWVGLGPGTEAWNQLVLRTRDAVVQVVPVQRDKPHTAHLTVARLRRPVDVGAIVDTLDRIPPVAMDVSKMSLVESVLGPDGARYTTLDEFELLG